MKRDKRVIDLRKSIPDYIPWPSGGTEGSTTREQSSLEPIQLTLCAGDGLQRHNDAMVTDIEWFTTGIEGFSREHKPTNVFCCSPDYNVPGLQHNIEYMEQHNELEILLVLCDTTNPVHLERFKELFSNRITTIREDLSCYGPALSTEILQKVLVTGGQYILDDHRKYNTYPRTDSKFTYELKAPNKLIITKISPTEEPSVFLSSRATKKRQLAGTIRKKRKGNNNKKKEGSKGIRRRLCRL